MIWALSSSFLLYFSVQKSSPATPLASQAADLIHQINIIFPIEELPYMATTMSRN